MTRLVRVNIDATVRLELPDDHPYFTVSTEAYDALADNETDDAVEYHRLRAAAAQADEERADIELKLIEQAQSILTQVYTAEDKDEAYYDAFAKIIYSDASVEADE